MQVRSRRRGYLKVAGVVSERDLFAMQRLTVRQLAVTVRRAGDVGAIVAAAADIRRLSYHLVAQGVAAPQLTRLISHLNDQLTVRVAKGNDLWLHVRGRTGAHVVLQLPRGASPDQESLLDAAHLAAWFSDARGEAAPEVVYTRAKHVRKVKGSAPGAVTYSQERALALRVEPARVERLLQAGPEGEET